MRLKAYENESIYKERIKSWYDIRLKKKEFKEGDKVLLYNSRFKTFGKGKLQSKWDGPYVVHLVLSNGAVTIMDVKGDEFMVNGQRLKVYYCHTRFYKENRMHLICAPGSNYTHMMDNRV
jgi:hypothetical protein